MNNVGKGSFHFTRPLTTSYINYENLRGENDLLINNDPICGRRRFVITDYNDEDEMVTARIPFTGMPPDEPHATIGTEYFQFKLNVKVKMQSSGKLKFVYTNTTVPKTVTFKQNNSEDKVLKEEEIKISELENMYNALCLRMEDEVDLKDMDKEMIGKIKNNNLAGLMEKLFVDSKKSIEKAAKATKTTKGKKKKGKDKVVEEEIEKKLDYTMVTFLEKSTGNARGLYSIAHKKLSPITYNISRNEANGAVNWNHFPPKINQKIAPSLPARV